MVGVLTIATVNVNGIRAAARRGMGEWLTGRRPDVVLLQEVRATDAVLADLVAGELEGGAGGAGGAAAQPWHVAHQASQAKGRAGVAVLSRLPVTAVRVGLEHLHPGGGPEPTTDTGRWVETDVVAPSGEQVTVVSAYLHSGTAGTPSMDEKYAYLEKVTARLAELRSDDARLAVVGGDLNIAHTNHDIKNWKGNLRSAGFLPQERAYLDRWFGAGWVDLGRLLAGERPGPYTWWSWRGKSFDNDAGWRIDYQLATPGLAARAKSVDVDRAPSYDARFSDHAPVVAVYDA